MKYLSASRLQFVRATLKAQRAQRRAAANAAADQRDARRMLALSQNAPMGAVDRAELQGVA
jgi:hypothetical protein